ncbi:RHS repeat-associated core domain-containing protein [Glaciecola sp. XM2]|nr:RHS repeat-associated core domain-containing protein [Glaciecola sp. XM2]
MLHINLLVSLLLFSNFLNAEVTYLHTDHLGSVVAKSNESGQVTYRYSYAPFGLVDNTQALSNKNSYTGHVYDDESDLVYMQARYHDPVIGRFYSNDPVDAISHLSTANGIHGFNRYAYANNNPYKFTDPTGLCSSNTTDSGREACETVRDTGTQDGASYKGENEDGVPIFEVSYKRSDILIDIEGFSELQSDINQLQRDTLTITAGLMAAPVVAGNAIAGGALATEVLVAELGIKPVVTAIGISFSLTTNTEGLPNPMNLGNGSVEFIQKSLRSQKMRVKKVKNDTVYIE